MSTLPSSATLVLTAVRRMMLSEIIKQPAAETITVPRDLFTLIIPSISEVLDTIAILEEAGLAADRLHRELAIARADVAHLEARLRVSEAAHGRCPHELDPAGKGRLEAEHHRLTMAPVIDISAWFGRGRRQSGPEKNGGAS